MKLWSVSYCNWMLFTLASRVVRKIVGSVKKESCSRNGELLLRVEEGGFCFRNGVDSSFVKQGSLTSKVD